MSRICQFENAAEIASQGGVAVWGLAAWAKGSDATKMMSELFDRATGYNKGKGG